MQPSRCSGLFDTVLLRIGRQRRGKGLLRRTRALLLK